MEQWIAAEILFGRLLGHLRRQKGSKHNSAAGNHRKPPEAHVPERRRPGDCNLEVGGGHGTDRQEFQPALLFIERYHTMLVCPASGSALRLPRGALVGVGRGLVLTSVRSRRLARPAGMVSCFPRGCWGLRCEKRSRSPFRPRTLFPNRFGVR